MTETTYIPTEPEKKEFYVDQNGKTHSTRESAVKANFDQDVATAVAAVNGAVPVEVVIRRFIARHPGLTVALLGKTHPFQTNEDVLALWAKLGVKSQEAALKRIEFLTERVEALNDRVLDLEAASELNAPVIAELPDGVSYHADHRTFYNIEGEEMNIEFRKHWEAFAHAFPQLGKDD